MGFSHSLTTFVTLTLLGASSLVSGRSLPKGEIVRRALPPSRFKCTYPEGWKMCNEEKRECWVRRPDGFEFNITTDYEDFIPEGIQRNITLELTETSISPDGIAKPLAKLINGTFPGPLIEACWGDTLQVTVVNKLPDNGTSIHWHGIRQLNTNHMDGVNGVTQCPTAENDSFTYKFRLTQYGHSWYHSHYSSQYGDGIAAPLLIHGPSSEDWEFEAEPIVVSDWLHESAFKEFGKEYHGPGLPAADSILINGQGKFYDQATGVAAPGGNFYKYPQKFEAGKRYLIRITNGSSGLHFHFSIDHHTLRVISTDFVPITPYDTNSLSVAIGQRYTVIVEAKPSAPSNGKFWMRTEFAGGLCNTALRGVSTSNRDQQRTGIISYVDTPEDTLPESTRFAATIACADEPYAKIKPKVEWNFGADKIQNDYQKNTYEAGLENVRRRMKATHWAISDMPMWLDMSKPTILQTKNDSSAWDPEYAIVNYNYINGDEYVIMVVTAGSLDQTVNRFSSWHPIHLHGHDFVVLAQGTTKYSRTESPKTFNFNNPPRRDVVMLPAGGYIAIAFKPDNPGVWLLHCHIAWHAGSGLALQVMERQSEIETSLGTGALDPIREGCKKWDAWTQLPGKFNPKDPEHGQEDSGI
ncbi:multicopper oxidase [Amniculicola lignicola CBS 123094]|uniref:Multicopper oxidase n=1 Tax=Amniculicola lignicola CBS 123094 TaxID=1392246 RepID=A0A6A5WXM5_9PLEO|nr:multicopper oxidase [Amniculicola lignicola CBS 123094]